MANNFSNLNFTRPLVSIIINCHNGNKYLDQCILSVINQTYKNWEIIFWDNASSEKSKILTKYYKNKKIKYFYNKVFTTLGEARNLAISNAQGTLIAFLDVDDYWEKDKLEKQVILFQRPEIGLVYTNSRIFSENNTIKHKMPIQKMPKGKVFKEMLSSYFIVMSSAMVRKKALKKLKINFNPNFEIIEEYDVFLRIALFYEVDRVEEVLTNWRWHKFGTTASKRNLITKEKRILLKLYNLEFKNFSKKYYKDIKRVKDKIFVSICVNNFLNHNSQKCRKLLLSSKKLTIKGVALFLMSYLKPSFASRLYEKIKGNPLI